jgi:hypothetical protein
MHDIVVNELEKHFSGDAPQSFYDHLEACPPCRAEVAEMDAVFGASQGGLFQAIKSDPDEAPEPRPGFFNRVVGEIVDHQKKEVWGLFSPGAAFFRRVAFASLLLLAGLGSFLVTRESSEGGADAVSIMAQQDTAGVHSDAADRDRLLVTLASWHQ